MGNAEYMGPQSEKVAERWKSRGSLRPTSHIRPTCTFLPIMLHKPLRPFQPSLKQPNPNTNPTKEENDHSNAEQLRTEDEKQQMGNKYFKWKQKGERRNTKEDKRELETHQQKQLKYLSEQRNKILESECTNKEKKEWLKTINKKERKYQASHKSEENQKLSTKYGCRTMKIASLNVDDLRNQTMVKELDIRMENMTH